MSYIFIKKPDPNNRFDQETIRVKTDQITVSELLSVVRDFLLACGFSINGTIEVVNEEDAE